MFKACGYKGDPYAAGKPYGPFRLVSEVLEVNVTWEPETGSIFISGQSSLIAA